LTLPVTILLALVLALPALGQEKRPLTFTDLMKLREIEQPSIADGGDWIAFTAEPDRGDPEVVVRSVDGATRYSIPLASNAVISHDGAFVAARLNPSMEESERAGRGDAPRRGMAVLNTATGAIERIADVQSFTFSPDGRWLAYHEFEAEDEEEGPTAGGEAEAEAAAGEQERGAQGEAGEQARPAGKRKPGTVLVLRELASGDETEIADVRTFTFAEEGALLAYAIASADNSGDGLYVSDLDDAPAVRLPIDVRPFGHYAEITWEETGDALAFVMAVEDKDGAPGKGTVMAWDRSDTDELVTSDDAPEGWFIPTTNGLRWSDDGELLFFGWRPIRADETEKLEKSAEWEASLSAGTETGEEAGVSAAAGEPATEETEGDETFDPYDTEAILADRGVDVWHWLDPRINPQQKVLWNREKDRTYMAVYHMDSGSVVALADQDVPDVIRTENPRVALMRSDVPYRWEATWTGGNSDAYVVDLMTGGRSMIAERLDGRGAYLSPEGKFAVYYRDGAYYLFDVDSGEVRNITDSLGVPIADEDHDYPEPAPGYGLGGWIEGDAAVLIYDKYDIWVIPTDGSDPWCLTEGQGRANTRIFRVIDTDPDEVAIGAADKMLLSSYHDLNKGFGFYSARADQPGVTRLIEEDKMFRFLAKAVDADTVLFTRQDYDEFPDLWVADSADFTNPRKLTDVNPNISEFAWGTSELTEWLSDDGIPLQGVVIKPGNYEEGKRYPVLVYFYRFFSQRLHEFNQPAVNHRPSFPLYASNGYVVFLPDVRFEVGRPGFSSTKCVVPGVQHLIDIGIADPNAIALHGHSWSGYQTAFMVTQTNIFTTAIAGAPVGNMTSAYSGIRLGSGLARQFQYEMSQSRLSGSLWEARDDYIDNSPVFFADKIQTPILILHGDVDDAVPWEQSIEFYLALRRNGKEAVFLQYNDEPHHPQKYPNKLDWAMKMKEWLDHYLKGAPAPEWISKGIPYTGK
jgi:dipeptidyl aminopeptidase/acylaminoacyl peptidase